MIQADPMTARAADSSKMLDYWDQTDTIVAGIKALRLAGETYLPKFVDEENDTYQMRLRLTTMTNVYRDIVESLSAKPFEKPVAWSDEDGYKPSVEVEEFAKDVDGAGNDLTMFASQIFFHGINSAIDWIFVDYPKVGPEVRTQADMKKAGIRPFWSRVLGRNVLEAKSQVVAGNERIVYIRIMEPGKPDHVRMFRVSVDVGANGKPVVEWVLYRKTEVKRKLDAIAQSWLPGSTDKDETFYELADIGILSIEVIPLVPFWTGRRHGRTFCFSPALRDAADLQIELYQQESALKFACTMTAFPMLAANGIKPILGPDNKPIKLRVGPNNVLYSTPDGQGNVGNWGYVEPNANSLKFLDERVGRTTQNVRELGKQPLTATSGNLTVITTAVAAGKAKSAVGAWANMLSMALDNALAITLMFIGIKDEKCKTAVYDDFDEFDASGNDLTALATMRKERDISQKTLWSEMQRRRVLNDKFDPEAELIELTNEAPKVDEMGDPENTA